MDINIVSKYRGPLYGFAIIWIMVFHSDAIDKVDYTFGHEGPIEVLATFIGAGNVGVDMFLFLSGICLYFSFSKDSNVAHFMKKRFARIFIPLWVIDGLYWIIRPLVEGNFGIETYISKMLLLRFWETGDQTCWYGSLIVFLYLLYPLFYSFIYSDRARRPFVRCLMLMALFYFICIAMQNGQPEFYDCVEISLTRVPVFIFGTYMGKRVFNNDISLGRWGGWAALALAVFFLAVKHYDMIEAGMYGRWFYAIGGVSFCYLLAWVFSFIDRVVKGHRSWLLRFLSWAGGISFELYLAHIMLNQVYRIPSWYVPGNGNIVPYLCVLLPCAFVVAWVGSKLAGYILKLPSCLNGGRTAPTRRKAV